MPGFDLRVGQRRKVLPSPRQGAHGAGPDRVARKCPTDPRPAAQLRETGPFAKPPEAEKFHVERLSVGIGRAQRRDISRRQA